MVSPIPYRNGKDLHIRRSDGSIVVAVLVVTLMAAKPSVTFFLVGVLYVASGPFDWYWRHRTGRVLEEAEAAATGDAGADAPGPAPQPSGPGHS